MQTQEKAWKEVYQKSQCLSLSGQATRKFSFSCKCLYYVYLLKNNLTEYGLLL